MTKDYRGYSAAAFAELEAEEYTPDQLAYYAAIEKTYLGEKITVVPFTLKADRETTPILGRDGQTHAVAAGYDGEGEGPRGGVYGWDCDCGASGTDYGDEDEARLGASMHLAEVETLAEVA